MDDPSLIDDTRDEPGESVLLGERRRGRVDFGKHRTTIAGPGNSRRPDAQQPLRPAATAAGDGGVRRLRLSDKCD